MHACQEKPFRLGTVHPHTMSGNNLGIRVITPGSPVGLMSNNRSDFVLSLKVGNQCRAPSGNACTGRESYDGELSAEAGIAEGIADTGYYQAASNMQRNNLLPRIRNL